MTDKPLSLAIGERLAADIREHPIRSVSGDGIAAQFARVVESVVAERAGDQATFDAAALEGIATLTVLDDDRRLMLKEIASRIRLLTLAGQGQAVEYKTGVQPDGAYWMRNGPSVECVRFSEGFIHKHKSNAPYWIQEFPAARFAPATAPQEIRSSEGEGRS